MASVRNIKKDIDYLFEEVISDCYMAIYFHPSKKAEFAALIDEAIVMHRGLIHRVNNPAEKKNPSLVRKHYAQIHRDLLSGIDELFGKLSKNCKAK